MKVPQYASCINLERFNLFVRMIERDARTTSNQKLVLKFRAWSYYVSVKSQFHIMIELPTVYR